MEASPAPKVDVSHIDRGPGLDTNTSASRLSLVCPQMSFENILN